jgi:hypothetical protein
VYLIVAANTHYLNGNYVFVICINQYARGWLDFCDWHKTVITENCDETKNRDAKEESYFDQGRRAAVSISTIHRR